VQLVAIGSGTPTMAKVFADEFGFKGDMYVDTKREVYQALDCKRGIGRVLGRKALGEYKKAYAAGYSQGGTQGDGLQLGGAFIIRKSGEIVWSHMEEYAGDHAPLEELVAKAREIGGGGK